MPLLVSLLLAVIALFGPTPTAPVSARAAEPAAAVAREGLREERTAAGVQSVPLVASSERWYVGLRSNDRTDPDLPDERERDGCASAATGRRPRIDAPGSSCATPAPYLTVPAPWQAPGGPRVVRLPSRVYEHEPGVASRDRHCPYLPAAPPRLV